MFSDFFRAGNGPGKARRQGGYFRKWRLDGFPKKQNGSSVAAAYRVTCRVSVCGMMQRVLKRLRSRKSKMEALWLQSGAVCGGHGPQTLRKRNKHRCVTTREKPRCHNTEGSKNGCVTTRGQNSDVSQHGARKKPRCHDTGGPRSQKKPRCHNTERPAKRENTNESQHGGVKKRMCHDTVPKMSLKTRMCHNSYLPLESINCSSAKGDTRWSERNSIPSGDRANGRL